MKYLILFFIPFAAQAQNLNCFVNYKGNSQKMYWFAQNQSHHAPSDLEYLNVQIQEKSKPGKFEVLIVEAADDEAWDKLVELTKDLEPGLKKKLIDLGRTRVTKFYASLYAGVFHYAFRLGTDPNLYEISCSEIFPKE